MMRIAAHCAHVLTLPDQFATPHGCCPRVAKLIRLVRNDVKQQNIIFFILEADNLAKYIVRYIVGKLLT